MNNPCDKTLVDKSSVGLLDPHGRGAQPLMDKGLGAGPGLSRGPTRCLEMAWKESGALCGAWIKRDLQTRNVEWSREAVRIWPRFLLAKIGRWLIAKGSITVSITGQFLRCRYRPEMNPVRLYDWY